MARSLQSMCPCGLFFAMTLPEPWALYSGHINGCTLTRYSQLARRLRKASLEEQRDLRSAFTSTPSTNPQRKGCPGTRATSLEPPQTATKAQTDRGLQEFFFFFFFFTSPSVPSTLQSQGHHSHHVLSAARTSFPPSPIHTRFYFGTSTLKLPDKKDATRLVYVANARRSPGLASTCCWSHPLPCALPWPHMAQQPYPLPSTCPWSNCLVLKDTKYSMPLLTILTPMIATFMQQVPE